MASTDHDSTPWFKIFIYGGVSKLWNRCITVPLVLLLFTDGVKESSTGACFLGNRRLTSLKIQEQLVSLTIDTAFKIEIVRYSLCKLFLASQDSIAEHSFECDRTR